MALPAPSPADLRATRAELLHDRGLTGSAWSRRCAAVADEWLARLFASAVGGEPRGFALLAVGGYGRGELAPGSDLDLLLVHDNRGRVGAVADSLWYPVWDTGVSLDHSVRTAKEVRSAVDGDIKVALGLLAARRVAGDEALAASVLARTSDQWKARAGRWLPAVGEMTRQRHAKFGDVAFLLEPDLKESHGGLRDRYLMSALAGVVPVLAGVLDDAGLAGAGETLARARVELQRSTCRSGNTLLLQDQDAVAASLGFTDADDLMAAVAEAGRAVAWAGDDAWRRLESWLAGPKGRGGGRDEGLEPGLVLRDGEVAVLAGWDLTGDSSLALRVAAASAELDRPIARGTLDRLVEEAVAPPGVWPPGTLQALLRLLAAGPPAVAAIEALDHIGIWVGYFPEWEAVRNRPQRNAYHRYTVDRHLLETAAGAASLRSSVARPDILLLGALLHDIGKGRGGDHTEIGIEIVGDLGPRLGLGAGDASTLQALVRHHLLLPDAATRRDLEDPATVANVAAAAGDRDTLDLLAALAAADGLATGPAAWGAWKAGLVGRLVASVAGVLEGRPAPDTSRAVLTDAERALLAGGGLRLLADGGRLTVAAPDRPGLLATVSGVLALAGVTVRSATTMSDEATAMALLRFDVAPAFDTFPDWNRVAADLEVAHEGRLDIDGLLAEREQRYARHRRPAAARTPDVRVTVDDHASKRATVVEVRAPDRGPVLYQVTSALAGCGLTITCALVDTLGAEAIDVFYVQDAGGEKLAGGAGERQIVKAVTDALSHGSRTKSVQLHTRSGERTVQT
ncbi:MAG: [protein-PII] uridylyltransferase [Acidimicrobiales bacterium]